MCVFVRVKKKRRNYMHINREVESRNVFKRRKNRGFVCSYICEGEIIMCGCVLEENVFFVSSEFPLMPNNCTMVYSLAEQLLLKT